MARGFPHWLAIVLLALVIRVGFCARYYGGPYPFADRYREYIISAQRLVEHGAYLSPFMNDAATAERSAIMPPLYTFWVAGVFEILGVESLAARVTLELANAMALALTCGLVFRITQELAGLRTAWVAGLIAALHPALIGYTNYIWDTSFFTLAVAFSVWIAIRLGKRNLHARDYFVWGIWLGIVALLNPALTLAYPILVLVPLTRNSSLPRGKALCGIAATIAGWAIVLTPWTIRNYVRVGGLHYVRSGLMLEVWMGMTPEAEQAGASAYEKHFPLKNPEVADHVTAVGERRYLDEVATRVRRQIAQDPLRYGKLIAMRAVDFWLGTALTHAGPHGRVIPATRSRQMVMAIFSLEVLLLAVAAARARFTNTEGLWLFSIVIAFSLIYLLTNVQVRFRVPIEPLFAVLISLAYAPAAHRPPTGDSLTQ